MALIKCTECGHEVSDKAQTCPNCGSPLIGNTVKRDNSNKKKIWNLCLIALAILLGIGGYYAYTKFFIGGSDKDAIVELTPEFIAAIEKYDQLGIFSEGYAAVRKGDKWGYINTKGEEIIPANIDAYCVGRFSEGLAFVAEGTDNANFSIINTEGKQIFQGKGYHNIKYYSPDSHDLPYFLNGKIYVPVLQSKRDVYDRQGNKLETITEEAADSIRSKSISCPQEVFVEETNCVGEVEDRICRDKYGVKDSVGNVIVAAKYDYIAFDRGEKWMPCLSNGVMLVVLEELDDNQFEGGSNSKPPFKKHYGYANLRGNDTFSESIKQKCQSSEQKAMDNYKSFLESFEQQQWNDTESYSDEYSQTSYNNERIVNIYFRYGQGSSSVEGNYGVERLRFGKYITKIKVPQGKVWVFKDYCCYLTPNGSYTAGFCDETGRETIELIDNARKGWWREISDMGGERFYGGKTIYMYWGAYHNFTAFNFEVNFIEKDD